MESDTLYWVACVNLGKHYGFVGINHRSKAKPEHPTNSARGTSGA
jgi:hypothetical protein